MLVLDVRYKEIVYFHFNSAFHNCVLVEGCLN